MFWVILTVIAILVMGGALVTLLASTAPGDRRDLAIGTLVITPLVWLAVSIGFSLHTVGQRQVGVVYNFSGTITGKVDPGIAWTMPWQHINKANVGIQREDFILDAGNAASSKDLQPIFANLTLNYQVEPAKIIELYKTVGPGWKETLLDSRVLQDFKEVTASFSAAEITTSRPQLRADTKARLSEELKKYDIHVVDFFVKNLGYSETYRQSIDRKNVQVQAALQAQAKVAQATAEANQAIATARGEAQSVLVKARADAEANRLKRNSLTPLLVRNNAIDKLSDNVKIICTGTCPWLPASVLGN
jgi:regulator of protease activity HflC (stomatin/prohibitin superfamily)